MIIEGLSFDQEQADVAFHVTTAIAKDLMGALQGLTASYLAIKVNIIVRGLKPVRIGVTPSWICIFFQQ